MMPTAVDLRVDARWIVPIVPASALPNHSLLIDGGRIVSVCATADAQRDYAAREQVTLSSHVLMPGLVNAHIHGAMTLMRGIADDLALEPWLREHVWPRESRVLGTEFVRDN
jgi:5-methylthioadenosine/S-adenosylhomocysteine deaminase